MTSNKNANVVFRGLYTRRDVYTAVILANRSSIGKRWLRFGLGILGAVVYIGYYLLAARQDPSKAFDKTPLGMHLFFLCLLFLFWIYPTLLSAITAYKLWKSPVIHAPYSGWFALEGVQYSGKKKLFAWKTMTKKIITSHLLILLTDRGVLCFFPRNFFNSVEDWQRVIELSNLKAVNVK
jgi:hypothetical protein